MVDVEPPPPPPPPPPTTTTTEGATSSSMMVEGGIEEREEEDEEDVRELEDAYEAAKAMVDGGEDSSSSSSPIPLAIEAFRKVLSMKSGGGGSSSSSSSSLPSASSNAVVDGPKASQIKERAFYDLARLLCKNTGEGGGGVGPIVELITGQAGAGTGSDDAAQSSSSSSSYSYLSALSKAKCAKVVRHVLDIVCARCPPSWQEQVASSVLSWTIREKRGFLRQRVESRLARIYYDQRRYVPSLELCDKLLQELKKLDDKQLLLETHLLESQIYYALRNPSKSKAALTSCRTMANAVYVSPTLQAEIDVMSGTLHTAEGDYGTGHSYFLEAFEQLDALGGGAGDGTGNSAYAAKATDALKYMMLCRILDGLRASLLSSSSKESVRKKSDAGVGGSATASAGGLVDLSSLLTPKQHLKYAGRDIEALQAIAAAASKRDLAEYDKALREYHEELHSDLLVHHHLRELRNSLLESNLVRVVEPYEVVQLSHVSAQMNMPVAEVERKCSQMILDGKLLGILDQGSGHLVLYEDSPQDSAMEKGLQVLHNVDGVVTSLFERSKALRTMMM
jgi:26S proteasome regulatory subunit N6